MKSIIAAIILAISLASTPAAPQTIVTIKPHQIKGLRGSGHVPPDGAVPAKKGFVFLVGFRFDGIKPSSIEAQFFHDEETHVFVRRNDKIGNEDEKEYYWYGEDTVMYENTMNLVFSEGVDGTNVMGSASVMGKVYNFMTIFDNSIQVIEVDGSNLPPELDASTNGSRNLMKHVSVIPPSDVARKQIENNAVTIDIICLYTPQTVCVRATGSEDCDATDPRNYRVMDSLCKLSTYETNVALENSGAKPKINLVFSGLISPSYVEEESEEMCRPLHRFKFSQDKVYSDARKLRDEYGADLVSLIVSRGIWCGCADEYSGSDLDAFSVVHEKCAAGYFSFGHEIGHNLGCGHSRTDSANDRLEGYAFGFKDSSNKFRTIMAYNCEQKYCPRIQNFSTDNPNIRYDGTLIGDSFHDNVRQINSLSAYVSTFRRSKGGSIDLFDSTASPSLSPTGRPISLPSPLPSAVTSMTPSVKQSVSPTQKPSIAKVSTDNPSEIVTCNKKKVTFTIIIETYDEGSITWYFSNARKQNKVFRRSSDFKSVQYAKTCIWSGSCFTFTIENSDPTENNLGQYRVYADDELVASGNRIDAIARHTISLDRKQKFRIGKLDPTKKKSCAWLDQRKQREFLCKRFSKFRSKCPETCGSCKF